MESFNVIELFMSHRRDRSNGTYHIRGTSSAAFYSGEDNFLSEEYKFTPRFPLRTVELRLREKITQD